MLLYYGKNLFFSDSNLQNSMCKSTVFLLFILSAVRAEIQDHAYIGGCLLSNRSVYQNYLDTKSEFYPYEPDVYGVHLFDERRQDRRNPTIHENPYHDDIPYERDCPVDSPLSLDNFQSLGPNARSMCPWHYVIDFNPRRLPTTLAFAKCNCGSCLDPVTNEKRDDLTCQRISYKMKVLRKVGCTDGFYKYQLEEQEIPVACACMRNPSAD